MDKQKENVNNTNDEIDLVQLVKVVVKRKWLIAAGTLLVTLAAVFISLLLPKVYQSSAFFRLSSGVDVDLEQLKEIQDKIRDNLQNDLLYNLTLEKSMILDEILENTETMMKNVSLPDYKKYLSRFTNPQQFFRFLEQKKEAGDKTVKELKRGIGTADDIAQWIEPVYAFTKRELKDLTQNPREAKNFVIGVQLTGEQGTPENARAFVNALGEFIKDSILHGKLGDYIVAQWNKSRTEYKKYDNFLVKDEFKLRQLMIKRGNIEQLMKKYPGSASMGSRELLSLDKNGHRYLSPVAQLVGIESHIADIKENLARNRRDQQVMGLKFEFFSKVKESMPGEKFGYAFLDRLMALKDSFFSQKELPDDAVRQVKNELAIDLDNFTNLEEEMQFISGPTMSKNPIKPRKALFVAVGFVLGFFISVFLAFVIDWWTVNKRKIVNPEAE